MKIGPFYKYIIMIVVFTGLEFLLSTLFGKTSSQTCWISVLRVILFTICLVATLLWSAYDKKE